ncbi:uncharacterized protein [Dermacentor albipictus]|uniref:uncharacterized protein isoform X2 n=1 Tax=Dermacentor albipictus TaxID=60249 RepID=UPI0038FCD3B9
MAPRDIGPHINHRQQEIIINFMERNPRLVKSGDLDPKFTAQRRKEMWEELAKLLNDAGPPTKPVVQWRCWWNRFVSRARADAGNLSAEMKSTGGGLLGGAKGRVLALLGPASTVPVRPAPFLSSQCESDSQQQQPNTSAVTEVSQPGDTSAPRQQPPSASTGVTGGRCTASRPPRAASRGRLLQQAVGDTSRRVALAAARNEVAEKLLEESRKQTAELRVLNNQVGRLADAMERQADALERQLRPISELATVLASFLTNYTPQV